MLRGRPAEKQPVNQPEHQICPCTAADQKQHRKIEVNDAIVKKHPNRLCQKRKQKQKPPHPDRRNGDGQQKF